MVDDVVKWFHLLAAAVWIGGSITVGALVPALRKAGATTEQIRAVARRFGTVAWTALATSIATGLIQVARRHYAIQGRLALKVALVGVAVVVAYVHQVTARRTPPAVRGALEGLSLLIALAILGVAVTL